MVEKPKCFVGVFGFLCVCVFLNTNLGVFVMVTQSRFTRSPTRTVEESGQFVADCFVYSGLFPQVTIVVQLKEKMQKVKQKTVARLMKYFNNSNFLVCCHLTFSFLK